MAAPPGGATPAPGAVLSLDRSSSIFSRRSSMRSMGAGEASAMASAVAADAEAEAPGAGPLPASGGAVRAAAN
eukprot:10258932-Lingulodinium_polyedra.AAC.1